MFEPESFVFNTIDLEALRNQVRSDKQQLITARSHNPSVGRAGVSQLRHDNQWNVAY
jgi:hypothetical protein